MMFKIDVGQNNMGAYFAKMLTVTPTNNTGAGLLFHSMKTTFYLVFIAIEI